MNNKRIIINFSNNQNDDKNSKQKKDFSIHKINIYKEKKSLELSNQEIDISIKRLKQKTIDISKNKKMNSFGTLPLTINTSNINIKSNLDINKNIPSNNNINNDIISINENKTKSKQLYINITTEPNKKKIDISSLLNKNNITNIIPYKKTIFNKIDSQNSIKKLSIDYYNAFQCLFCEKIFKDNEISKLIKCKHKFCNECGEQFYYDLISDGYSNQKFKCPLIKCQKEISYNIIELLLSSKNFDTFRTHQNKQDQQDKQDNEITNRNFIYNEKENNKDNNNSIYNYPLKKRNNKICDKQNILDIKHSNSYNLFHLQSKKNFILCPKCGKNSLYRKANKYFLKCLNCKNKVCKFCSKILTEDHFEIENVQRCKVYFRINKYKKKNILNRFFKQIFLNIAGYLFLMTFFIIKMKNIYKNQKDYSSIKIILLFLLYFILLIDLLPIALLIIPYYPIITCI